MDNFWSKVNKSGPVHAMLGTRCWLWTAAKNALGYGSFGIRGVGTRLAHRVAWELCVGPIAPGLLILHKCDVPACVNPNHLFAGTNADNMRDMALKGRRKARCVGDDNGTHRHPERVVRGERCHDAKLTPNQVVAIRELYEDGATRAELARYYGVSWPTIDGIIARRKWKHVV